jgi:F-type H+-transporting ATPase subunit b
MEFFKKFGIDWRLVLGQILNFAVLLFLLERFVFKRFLKILGERKKEIETGIKLAEKVKERIEEIKKQREKILENARKKANEILYKAVEAGEIQKKKIIDEAIAEAELKSEKIIRQAKERAKREAEREILERKKEYLERITNLTFSVFEKILKEKITIEEDKKIIEDLIEKI